ncbi:hypothetical protein D9V37_16335 [Nocardioides mangrovicus]|uniref:DUF3558 domain-containing protein n=1 Tax=Nocardioides mangrovicus TaxID=2478913 RepID=A0A3L8NX16_9ACTN|nr:hypothetical protein [Nocardioides mangrovicus]RLV47715.1 hypothetical protein D9V37_16335 [Nocardioides mangrovicus]
MAAGTAVGVLIGLSLVPAAAQASSGPTCASESEYVHLQRGDTKKHAKQILSAPATFHKGGCGGYTLAYPRCDNPEGRVFVTYYMPRRGPAVVDGKAWSAVSATDVQVIQKNDRGNSIDLTAMAPHAFHVYAGGGNDYIFMEANGLPDVIRCGAGKDIVQYLDRREPQDRYVGCEHVELYSP